MSDLFPAIEIGGSPPLGMSSFDAMGEVFDGYDAGGNAGLSRFGSRFFAPMMGEAFCPPCEPCPEPDDTPPEVTIISPSVGSTITPTTPLVLRVTDETELGRVLLYAKYRGKDAAEVIHDGGDYLPPYAHSSRSEVPGGWQYTLRRTGGWPGSPSLYVRAVDRAGNEVSL